MKINEPDDNFKNISGEKKLAFPSGMTLFNCDETDMISSKLSYFSALMWPMSACTGSGWKTILQQRKDIPHAALSTFIRIFKRMQRHPVANSC